MVSRMASIKPPGVLRRSTITERRFALRHLDGARHNLGGDWVNHAVDVGKDGFGGRRRSGGGGAAQVSGIAAANANARITGPRKLPPL